MDAKSLTMDNKPLCKFSLFFNTFRHSSIRVFWCPMCATSYRSCDLKLLECNKSESMTIKLLPTAEIVTLNYWSATKMWP